MLRAFDERTGEPVNIGDTVTSFRGETATLHKLDRARETGRTGKVTVKADDGTLLYHYDNVWSLRVEDVDDDGAQRIVLGDA